MTETWAAGYDTLPDDELDAAVQGLAASTQEACYDARIAFLSLADAAKWDADQVVAVPPEAWTLNYSDRVDNVRRAIGKVAHEREKLAAAATVRNRRAGLTPGSATPGRSPG